MRCMARQTRRTDRNGMVAVHVVVSMTALVGVAAVVLDGGLLLTERRHAQAAADAAALAGATDLFKNFKTNGGADSSGSAAAAARDYVTNNYASAFQSNLATTIVNIPPSSSQSLPAHRKAGYVEVIVQYNHPRLFSSIFGGSSIPISARAVAQGTFLPPAPAVMALDKTASPAFKTNGGGSLNISGTGTLVVDSNGSPALSNVGGGTINAPGGIDVTGSVSGGGTYNPAVTTGTAPIPDPYAFLPEPTTTNPGPSTAQSGATQRGNTGIWDMYPGVYASDPLKGGQAPKNGDTVYFHQGVYYMQAGMTQQSGTNLIMARYDPANLNNDNSETGGMMLYIAGGALSLAGNTGTTLRLDGMSSGTYQQMLIFQSRTDSQKMSITGNGTLFSLSGEIYAPDAEIDLAGNGAASTIGTGVIADTLVIAGNGTINVNYSGSTNTATRILTLVE
jgi:hypothetical protein